MLKRGGVCLFMLVGILSPTFAEVREIMSQPERKFSIPSSEEAPFLRNNSVSIAVMGVAAVGKGTLVSGFIRFWTDKDRVVKLADNKKIVGKTLDVEIVDITSEQFLLEKNIPTANVYVLVYSVVCEDSLTSVMSLKDEIVKQKGKQAPIVAVANKADLALTKSFKNTKDLVTVSAELAEGIDEVLGCIIKKFLKDKKAEKRTQRCKRFERLGKLFSRSARVAAGQGTHRQT